MRKQKTKTQFLFGKLSTETFLSYLIVWILHHGMVIETIHTKMLKNEMMSFIFIIHNTTFIFNLKTKNKSGVRKNLN